MNWKHGLLCTGMIGVCVSVHAAELPVRAVKVNAPPVVDGRLDDPAWRNAPVYGDFGTLDEGAPAASRTQIQCLYDREKMYFAIRCAESSEGLRKARAAGAEVKKDDACVEMYFQPVPVTEHLKYVQVPGMWYYVLGLNAAGAHYGQCGRFVPLPGTFDVKTRVDGDFWQAEVAVPFASLKAKPPELAATWKFQVRRNAFVGGRWESSTLFPARLVANNVETFGTLQFADPAGRVKAAPTASSPSPEAQALNTRRVRRREALIRALRTANRNVALVPHPPLIDSRKVLPEFLPAEADLGKPVRVRLTKNEWEPASFVLWSPRPYRDITLKVADLSGTAGTLPARAVDLRWVKCWYQAGTHVIEICGYELTPELLLKNPQRVRVDLARRKNILDYVEPPKRADRPDDARELQPLAELPAQFAQQVWLTVRVPAQTLPGTYRGTIAVMAEDRLIGRIPLEIEILDFDLQESKLDSCLYVCSGWGPSATENSPVCAQAEMTNLVAHGVRYVGLWEHAGDMDVVVRRMREAGLRTDRVFIGNVGSPIPVRAASDKPADVYERARVWARSLAATPDVKEIYQYLVDEAGGDTLAAERPLAAALHRAGAGTWVACRGDYFPIAGDFIDLAVVGGVPDRSLACKVHQAGKRIYSYADPQCGLELPETYRRNFGLLLWQADYDGAFDFAYNCAFDDPWNDVDHGVWKDHLMAYPTRTGVIDTIQWEGWREGVDDCRYLATLEYWKDRAQAAGRKEAADQAQTWLKAKKNGGAAALSDLEQTRDDLIRLIRRCRAVAGMERKTFPQ